MAPTLRRLQRRENLQQQNPHKPTAMKFASWHHVRVSH